MSGPKNATRSSKGPGYHVEARRKYGPKLVGQQIFDGEWRRIEVSSAPPGFGIPNSHPHSRHLDLAGLMSYEAAQALRWWFLASVGGTFSGFETRLVKHSISFHMEIAEGEPVDDEHSPTATKATGGEA